MTIKIIKKLKTEIIDYIRKFPDDAVLEIKETNKDTYKLSFNLGKECSDKIPTIIKLYCCEKSTIDECLYKLVEDINNHEIVTRTRNSDPEENEKNKIYQLPFFIYTPKKWMSKDKIKYIK